MRCPTIASAIALALLLPLALPARADKPRKPTPALPAAQYPLHDTHDKITVAAEPGDIKDAIPNTRLDYAHHGFLPIRVIITNDSDQALTLDDARIHFISAHNDTVQAATDDDLQRRLFSRKYVSDSHIPLPAPLPSIPIHHKQVDKQILADDNDFGFASTTVAAHTTASGYLYYDVRDLDDPVLDHATLEVREVRIASTNKEIDSFEIPLKPTPESKSTPAPPAKP
ncbi:MAG TPA: hypothetical protein VIJ79_05105 [Acidobacteriaceae bacterium]